jgi:hypothetical protein
MRMRSRLGLEDMGYHKFTTHSTAHECYQQCTLSRKASSEATFMAMDDG